MHTAKQQPAENCVAGQIFSKPFGLPLNCARETACSNLLTNTCDRAMQMQKDSCYTATQARICAIRDAGKGAVGARHFWRARGLSVERALAVAGCHDT